MEKDGGVFFYLEENGESLSFASHIIPGEIYEQTELGEDVMDYAEYSDRRYESRQVLDENNIDLPGNFELAEMALQRIPDSVLTERFARETEEAMDLARFGRELEPGKEESQEAFLKKASSEYSIDELIDIQQFTDELLIETGYIHALED